MEHGRRKERREGRKHGSGCQGSPEGSQEEWHGGRDAPARACRLPACQGGLPLRPLSPRTGLPHGALSSRPVLKPLRGCGSVPATGLQAFEERARQCRLCPGHFPL